MTFEEAEIFFDLTAIASNHQRIHHQISAVSTYLYNRVNWLGSRSLAEATNPVGFSNRHHFLDEPISSQYPLLFWAYDERLVDIETKSKEPILQLEKIPEGFIPFQDTKGFLRKGIAETREKSPERFWAYGILKPMEDQTLCSKGMCYFVDIREVHYKGHSYDHMWGEFGVGFFGLASFHEE